MDSHSEQGNLDIRPLTMDMVVFNSGAFANCWEPRCSAATRPSRTCHSMMLRNVCDGQEPMNPEPAAITVSSISDKIVELMKQKFADNSSEHELSDEDAGEEEEDDDDEDNEDDDDDMDGEEDPGLFGASMDAEEPVDGDIRDGDVPPALDSGEEE